MKLLPVYLLFLSISASAQWKDYTISIKGDTLNRVDMQGKKQGPWVIHVDDLRGERGYEEEGYYENDVKEGLWKRFSLQGIKIAEENYRWGKLNGRCRYFTYNGGLEREENWRAMDPSRQYDTVAVYDARDPNKIIGMVVVKNEGLSLKHGTWNYFDPVEGVIVQTEKYQLNKLVTDDGEMIDEELRPIGITNKARNTDTTGKAGNKPKVVLEYEKKNSGKKKVRTRDGSTAY